MGLWTLGQNERFYTDIKRNPIAGILREELRITSQQGRKILEQSQKIRDLSENLKECLRLLGKLKSICEHKQKIFSDRMSKCQEILTPLQVVKLLLWVDDNSNILESTVSLDVSFGWAITAPHRLTSCSCPPFQSVQVGDLKESTLAQRKNRRNEDPSSPTEFTAIMV